MIVLYVPVPVGISQNCNFVINLYLNFFYPESTHESEPGQDWTASTKLRTESIPIIVILLILSYFVH